MRTLADLGTIAVNLLGELVAPSRCAACDVHVAPSALFCPACASSVERWRAPDATSPSWRAAFDYGGAIATAIARMKYQGRPDLGPRLGRAMLDACAGLRGAIDVVAPVPLHARRLAERGYNQAALLAAPVARATGAAYAPRALVRSRDTPRQAARNREERLSNLTDAFSVRAPRLIEGARVLLVDDVWTTGATLRECASTLRHAGAANALALVLAQRA